MPGFYESGASSADPVSRTSKGSDPAATVSDPGAGAGAAGGASLPVTGTNTIAIAGLSALLVGAGSALFLVARRRRVRFMV